MSGREAETGALARFVVRMASGIVPGSSRREWRAEWHGELCHVCRTRSCDPVRFAMGAFPDALWIRADGLSFRQLIPRGSAVRCLAALLLLAAVGLLLCVALPGPRRAFSAVRDGAPANLVVISSDGYAGTQSPSISLAHYREWRANGSHLFRQVAFCRPEVRRMRLAHHPPAEIAVAVASENLLRVLGFSGAESRSGEGRLFLSRSVWRTQFHADPRVIGQAATVDGSRVTIAGLLPEGGWHLPGQVQAVLTGDGFGSLPSTANGYVFARLRSSAFPKGSSAWPSFFAEGNNTLLEYECIPFNSIFEQPIGIFLFALLAACIALPATTALRLGDYPEDRGRVTPRAGLRRWSFLLAKLALVVAVAGLWSFALAYASAAAGSSAALYIQMGTAFPGLLCAFRWALHDQRKRCPECLRLLSNAARVGQTSCNFLAWCGTERMYQSGHGLLHIPELPTCWFSTQRWLCLDASWASLFPSGGS